MGQPLSGRRSFLGREPISPSLINPTHTSPEIEEIYQAGSLEPLQTKTCFCGAQAIHWKWKIRVQRFHPEAINRILSRQGWTHRRTGRYEAKGTPYPKLPPCRPNQTHQAIGLSVLFNGPLRFYSLNVVDTATERCGLHPSVSKAGSSYRKPSGRFGKRLGLPDNLQIDNEAALFGSPVHSPWYGAADPVVPAYRRSNLGSFPMAEPGAMGSWRSSRPVPTTLP